MVKTIQLIQITPEELTKVVTDKLALKLSMLNAEAKKPKKEEYLSREEVAKLFKVDLSTIHNWRKRGVLKACQIGGRVYFKLSEIENAIVELKA